MIQRSIALWAVIGALAAPAGAGPIVIDPFETTEGWSARPADGVELSIGTDRGLRGRALRLDFRFLKGGGYAVAHKELALDLPENYRFRFHVRGQCPPENLEFKLIDTSGENVWWSNQRDFHFPSKWDSVSLKKRHIPFAWGPAGGGEIRHVAAIEFAITAGSGGSGTVWLDDLTLEGLPPPSATPPHPFARASSFVAGSGPERVLDGDVRTAWESRPSDASPQLTLDLGEEREFGGLILDWLPGKKPRAYVVETSEDGRAWRAEREVRGARSRDYLYLPDREARSIRIRSLPGARSRSWALGEISLEPVEWSSSLNAFFTALAKDGRRGSYPRGITGEQSYWTVAGADGDRAEILLNEDGAIETGKGSFSIEPFLYAGDSLITWADGKNEQWLAEGDLPVPSVRWKRGDLELVVTVLAGPALERPALLSYRVFNRGAGLLRPILYLAARPFQVNPPSQFLNTTGGVAPLKEISGTPRGLVADGRRVVCLTRATAAGVASFDDGDVVEFLGRGRLPSATRVTDPFGHASGALSYPLSLAAGDSAEVDLLLYGPRGGARTNLREEVALDAWRDRIEKIDIELPGPAADVERTLMAQVGYILVNRDSAGIQPGSRSYERSWIRDGSLTSTALLRVGLPGVVREFIDWFAPYQYADGKVPCCVDARGSDPVPEHDSSGEFIYLVAEYFRYTLDRPLVERLWPRVGRAAAYLDSLRQTRRTAEWRAPDKIEFFGLLPPSISHEGYSAKPMHSYWDDLFALRGFKDAAFLADALGREDEARHWAAVRDEFQTELVASIRSSMKRHKIDYIPGAADLGDFDATSTTIALSPVEADDALPRAALRRTFEKYYEFFRDRRDGRAPWEAFTPYEIRNIGAFVRLGWRDRANELLEFFLRYRRPPGWRQWAEVVWHDERAPHFIGDMPHTWVGSDFIRSALDMLVYEREADRAIVVGAGVPFSWVGASSGIHVAGLPTTYGTMAFTMRTVGTDLEVRVEKGIAVPSGGIVIDPPSPPRDRYRRVTLNGKPVRLSPAGKVVVRELPAMVRYSL